MQYTVDNAGLFHMIILKVCSVLFSCITQYVYRVLLFIIVIIHEVNISL